MAWGQRPVIIKKCQELMRLMDYSPYEFILNAKEKDLERFENFCHRTFNSYDCCYFLKSLQHIYINQGGLEKVFTTAYLKHLDMVETLKELYNTFTFLPYEKPVLRHIANVNKNSAAKRVNMFLRWMIREDARGIDFGLWKNIPSSALLIPLDVHSGNVSRALGLLTRKQNDIKAVLELTEELRKFDANDPIKYDYALFGIGAFKN
ncbi:MAG: TIGR02757 family protein, partial [Odoribacter sp.]|nr:TIGR02757 family protein [Odoribacter sp.]